MIKTKFCKRNSNIKNHNQPKLLPQKTSNQNIHFLNTPMVRSHSAFGSVKRVYYALPGLFATGNLFPNEIQVWVPASFGSVHITFYTDSCLIISDDLLLNKHVALIELCLSAYLTVFGSLHRECYARSGLFIQAKLELVRFYSFEGKHYFQTNAWLAASLLSEAYSGHDVHVHFLKKNLRFV